MKRKRNKRIVQPAQVPSYHMMMAQYPETMFWYQQFNLHPNCCDERRKELMESLLVSITHPIVACWFKATDVFTTGELVEIFQRALNVFPTIRISYYQKRKLALALLKAVLNSQDIPCNLRTASYVDYTNTQIINAVTIELGGLTHCEHFDPGDIFPGNDNFFEKDDYSDQ